MELFTILWIIFAAILINLFRWLGRSHPGPWMFFLAAGLFLSAFSGSIPVKEKFIEIAPTDVTYAKCDGNDFIIYKLPNFSASMEVIDSNKLIEEKNKKFYLKKTFAYFGCEAETTKTVRK